MNSTNFNGWYEIGNLNIDEVSNFILTGRKANEAHPDLSLFKYLGDFDKQQTIIDFGCGMGRNSLPLANINKKWNIIGYDNDNMIKKVAEYSEIYYDGTIPKNLSFTSDWDTLKKIKVDKIICILVLQHIYESDLLVYVKDFKEMTKLLLVSGRRYNDDISNRSTWTILEENGLLPNKFFRENLEIPYEPVGDLNEHNTAIYIF